MPKLTLLLGRRTMQVYDLDQATIVIGRSDAADIIIDNPSVSRRHAQVRQVDGAWVVEDLGSSNGTFLGDQRIDGARALEVGDEVGFGKFSIVFDKVVGDGDTATGRSMARISPMGAPGTMHMRASEVRHLLEESERKKQAHLTWESADQRGSHYLAETSAVLFGTDELCDVRVPKGPKHHVLIVNGEDGCEVRNLTSWSRMMVAGRVTKKAVLKDGDVAMIGGLKLTFVEALS